MRRLVTGLVLAGVIRNNKIQLVKIYKKIKCYLIQKI